MLKEIRNFENKGNYYKTDYNIFAIRGRKNFELDTFLKMYKNYIGEEYPKFAKVKESYFFDGNKFITEKSIEELTEKVKINLNKLKCYDKDKRVVKGINHTLNKILESINRGNIILNEVEFDNIDKSFMNGEDVDSSTITFTYNPLFDFQEYKNFEIEYALVE